MFSERELANIALGRLGEHSKRIGWICDIHQTAGFFVGKKIGYTRCLECWVMEPDFKEYAQYRKECDDHVSGFDDRVEDQKIALLRELFIED